MILIIVVAGTALGAAAPKSTADFALSVLLSIAGLFPIGRLIAAVARTADSASVVGRLVLFPLMFLAGLWWPRELMPGVLQAVSGISPLGAAVEAIQDSMQGQFPRPCRCWSWRRTRWCSASWRGACSGGSSQAVSRRACSRAGTSPASCRFSPRMSLQVLLGCGSAAF